MACMPIDTHAHTSEEQHAGAGMTSMLHADPHVVSVWGRIQQHSEELVYLSCPPVCMTTAWHYICHALLSWLYVSRAQTCAVEVNSSSSVN